MNTKFLARLFSRSSDGAQENSAAGASPLRPMPPLAKRLNRNALTVAAVIMGMTVLTAVVLLNPGRDTDRSRPAQRGVVEEPPVPSRPTFLDEPVHGASAGVPTPVPGRVPSDEQHEVLPSIGNPEPAPSRSDTVRSQWPADRIDSYSAYSPTPPAPAPSGETLREKAFQAALMSQVMIGASRTVPANENEQATGSLNTGEEQLLSLSDSILRSAVRQAPSVPGASSTSASGASDRVPSPNTGTSRSAFLRLNGDAGGATIKAQIEDAGSPYTLRAGTVIPGNLITGINSDLPGEIVAQVSRDVYDSRTQRIVLVPMGSRLIGTYDNQVAAGQGRLLVAWTRLILPDGRSMRLPGLALKDAQGQTGAKDKIDNHWRRVFGDALLLSAISAGVQLSQPQQTSVLAPPSSGQIAAGALGQELSNVALEILRRGMDVAPTITIRPGQPFNVFLNGDLVFAGPYEKNPHVGG